MTTTAEKIKVMQAFEDGEEIEVRSNSAWGPCPAPEWMWGTCNYRIKPADPEPLECWVIFDEAGDPAGAYPIDQKEYALSSCYITAHMREVTPQDEEREKDAARYREAKELAQSVLWSRIWDAPGKWDERIDKEMESDER